MYYFVCKYFSQKCYLNKREKLLHLYTSLKVQYVLMKCNGVNMVYMVYNLVKWNFKVKTLISTNVNVLE